MTGWRTLTVAALLLLLAGSSSLAANTDGATPAQQPEARWGYGMMGGYGDGPMMGYGRGGPGYGSDFHGMGPWMMGGMWGASWGDDDDSAVEFVDGRLAFLKAELKITDKQMPEWNAFASAVRANAKTINLRVRPFYAGHWAAKPLPERLDDQEKVLAARLEAFKRTSAAVKPLYAAFDDAQKKVADVILLGPMGGGFHHGF